MAAKAEDRGKAEAEGCRDLGNYHFKNGNYGAAVCAYMEGLAYFKNDSLLHCNLAQAYIKLKEYRPACFHASQAIDLNPTYWKGYARLAKALYEIGQKFDSIQVLMQGVSLCEQKDELQKCFFQIPATSDEWAAAKAAKKQKKLSSEEVKKKESLKKDSEKQSQKSSDKQKDSKNSDIKKTNTKKMDKFQNTVSVDGTASSTTSSKAKSSEKKPVDFQDINNDQFLALAEKCSSERYSDQRKEFEKLLKDGYEEAQKESFSKAYECYKKAVKIMEEVPLKYLGIQGAQSIVMTYILNLMRINTVTFENLQQTIIDLKTVDEVGHFRILPAFYYIKSLAYFKLNRFKVTLEELESCNDLLSLNFPFIHHCWPSTSVIIKETTKEGLKDAVNELMMQAKSCLHNVPAAVCRFSQCLEVSSHILPSEQIFLTDPDFVGYVTITCEEKCHVQYHMHCWKTYRERLSEFEKIADKDMLGKPCPTTDCLNSAGTQSTILLIEIYGQDGTIKTQMKLDPIAAAAKQQSKNKKKKEDTKPEEKKEKALKPKKPRQRRKSQSDKKSVEPKSPLKPKKEAEEAFNGKMAQLINLRAINFGCNSNSWNPNETFYGRSDEKELSNSFVLKRVDNPLYVPDHNDQMTIIRMKFYKWLRKESVQHIDTVEDHWNDDEEFSSEMRKTLNGTSIVEFLLQSTLFALLDDMMCISENLPEAYKETEETLQQSVAFMIDGFTEAAKETKNPEESKGSQADEVENNEQVNKQDEEDVDDFEEDIEYNSESGDCISDGESSDCYESSENEDCLSELEDEDKEDSQHDQHSKTDEFHGSSVEKIKVDSRKIICEQSIQTENDEGIADKNLIENLKKKIELFNENFAEKDKKIDALEAELTKLNRKSNSIQCEQSIQTDNDDAVNSEKNVIENLRKKIDLFNENLTEKNAKIDELEAELSQSNSLKQKLETENSKLMDQKEKINKKLHNQNSLFKKKEADLSKEIEQLKSERNACRDRLTVLESEIDKLLVSVKQRESDVEQYHIEMEQTVRDMKKANEELKLNNIKTEKEGFLIAIEMLEKRCYENISELEALSLMNRLSSNSKIKDLLDNWKKFKLKLTTARNKMETNVTENELYKLIESIQGEEPQRIPILNFMKGLSDSPNPTVSEVPIHQLQQLMRQVHHPHQPFHQVHQPIHQVHQQIQQPHQPIYQQIQQPHQPIHQQIQQQQPQNPMKPVNGKVFTLKPEVVPMVSAAVVPLSPPDDDSASSSNHSIELLPNLHRSNSMQSAHSAQNEAAAPQRSADSPNEGVWEVSGSKHSNRTKPDQQPTTSIPKKRQLSVLRAKLKESHPNKTENELEECIKIVRNRNNNSLTGLRLVEIEYRVGKVLEERSKKPSTMGLDKFGKDGWCKNNTVENNWSGNIELEDCIICSEEIERRNLTTLECQHYFHTECIRKWLKEKSICPLCTTFTKMPDEFPAL